MLTHDQLIENSVRALYHNISSSPSLENIHLPTDITQLKSSEPITDYEIIFRKLVGIIRASSKDRLQQNEELFKLLNFSIQCNEKSIPEAIHMKRIPFLLMEDILDTQTVEESECMWSIVESMKNLFKDPEYFTKGKFIVLRTCNALLRKLSKSRNTELCGRILLFLATVYPVTERSSVNVNGKVNTGNVTIYADQEAFHNTLESMKNKQSVRDISSMIQTLTTISCKYKDNDGADIATTATTMTSAMKESKASIFGQKAILNDKKNAQNAKKPMEEREEGEEISTSSTIEKSTPTTSTTSSISITEIKSKNGDKLDTSESLGDKEKIVSSYDSYATFWKLQHYFNTDMKKMEIDFGLTLAAVTGMLSTNITTITSVGTKTAGTSGVGSNSNSTSGSTELELDIINGRSKIWREFVSTVQSIFQLFETLKFSNSEISQSKNELRQEYMKCIQSHTQYRHKWIKSLYTQCQETQEQIASTTYMYDISMDQSTNEIKSLMESILILEGSNKRSSLTPDIKNDTSNSNNGANGDISEEYMGCKYLTSPTLFELQLFDTAVRQEVLVQIILFVHNLYRKLPVIVDTINTALANTATTTSTMVNTMKSRGTVMASASTTGSTSVSASTSTTAKAAVNTTIKGGTTTSSATTSAVTSTTRGSQSTSATITTATSTTTLTGIDLIAHMIREDIYTIKTKAMDLLRQVPPNSEQLIQFLECLLKRENRWILWKSKACPDFERVPVSISSFSTLNDTANLTKSESTIGMKRKSLDSSTTTTTTADDDIKPFHKKEMISKDSNVINYVEKSKQYICELSPKMISYHSTNIIKNVPSFNNHLFSYVEADDPDNGIEDIYHPKHDQVYCWRARRLMAKRKLSIFEHMADGSISKGLQALYGKKQVSSTSHIESHDATNNDMEIQNSSSSTLDSLITPVTVSSSQLSQEEKQQLQSPPPNESDESTSSSHDHSIIESNATTTTINTMSQENQSIDITTATTTNATATVSRGNHSSIEYEDDDEMMKIIEAHDSSPSSITNTTATTKENDMNKKPSTNSRSSSSSSSTIVTEVSSIKHTKLESMDIEEGEENE